jgi:hypothetical protein
MNVEIVWRAGTIFIKIREEKFFVLEATTTTKREDGEKQQREEGRGKNQNQRKWGRWNGK